MNELSDQQLLRNYAEHQSETAFAELTQRHIGLVYSAALRMVRDAELAKDVTQAVFTALAQQAGQLTNHPVLSGWLHRTAQNTAAKAVRTNVRRQTREQEAAVMNELLSTETDPVWENVAPRLDEALGELSDADRDAVMLRYFEQKSAREMAEVLGISDEAAQKRVNRAVERLREGLGKRGVTAASGLALAISANAVQAAPAGLAATVSAAAVLAGSAVSTSTIIVATTKAVVMTAWQKGIVAATVAIVAGAGIYEARQNIQLRGQIASLREENRRLAGAVAARSDVPDPPSMQIDAPVGNDNGRALGMAVVKGDPAAFDKILAMSKAELENFNTHQAGMDDRRRGDLARETFAPLRSVYDVISEAGAKGNKFALDAVQRSLAYPELQGVAVSSLGVFAGSGNEKALNILLDPEKNGILLSSAVGALRPSAENGNEKAIEALVAVTRNPKDQGLWFMAADGLNKAARSGNAAAIDAYLNLLNCKDESVRRTVVSGLRLAAANQSTKATEALRSAGIE